MIAWDRNTTYTEKFYKQKSKLVKKHHVYKEKKIKKPHHVYLTTSEQKLLTTFPFPWKNLPSVQANLYERLTNINLSK